jgi:hypothetical protein
MVFIPAIFSFEFVLGGARDEGASSPMSLKSRNKSIRHILLKLHY